MSKTAIFANFAGDKRKIMQQKIRGLVLRTVKVGDSSLVVDLFTEEQGRMSFVAHISASGRRRSSGAAFWRPLNMVEFDTDLHGKGRLPHARSVRIFHNYATLPYKPVKQMIAIAHRHGVPVLIDGAQAAPHVAVDVQDLDCDFYAFSSHKMYGPAGVGILYGKRSWLEKMPPYQGGGEMIGQVTFERTTFADLPFKFEAGTPDFVDIAAFGAAIDYIKGLGLDNIAAHEHELLNAAVEGLQTIDGIRFFGTAPGKSGVVSFLVGDINSYDMGLLLDKLGVAVRTGHHCAQPLMARYGVTGMVRASFAVYNTLDEVDAFVNATRRVAAMLS